MYLYTDYFNSVQDNYAANITLFEQYEIFDERKHAYQFNKVNGKLLSWINNVIYRDVFYKETYKKAKEDYVNSNIDSNKIETYDKDKEDYVNVTNYWLDEFILYDDENEAILLNHYCNKKLIKRKTALYTFNPIYFELYDKDIYEELFYNITSIEKESYKVKYEVPEFITGLSDQFVLYDDENEALRLNYPNNKKFIKYKTAKYSFTEDVIDYYQHPITDNINFTTDQFDLEYYQPKEETVFPFVYLNDSYQFYDDENDSIRLNDFNDKKFIKKRSAIYAFYTDSNDQYKFDILDSFIIGTDSSIKEQYKDVEELSTIDTSFTEDARLYDDENEALKTNDYLNKKFIKFRTAKYYLSLNKDDIYDLPIYDKVEFITSFLNKENYQAKEELMTSSTWWSEKYNFDVDPLRLNSYNNKQFISSLPDIYSVQTNMSDIYQFKPVDILLLRQFYKQAAEEQFNKPEEEMMTTSTDFTEDAHLYDDENEAIKFNDYLHKKFIKYRTAKYSLSLNKDDEYIFSIIDLIQSKTIKSVNEDIYDFTMEDQSFLSTAFADEYTFKHNFIQLNGKSTGTTFINYLNKYSLETNANDIYQFDVNEDSMLSLTQIYKDTYDFKVEDVYELLTNLTEHYYLNNDDDDFIKLNQYSNKRFIKQRAEVYQLFLIYNEKYNLPIFENVKNQWISSYIEDTFTTPEEDYLDSNVQTTDQFILYDDENEAMRLNFFNNKKFIKYRTATYNWDYLIYEYCSFDIHDDIEYILGNNVIDAYKTKNDDIAQNSVWINEIYSIQDNALQLNNWNGRFISHINIYEMNPCINEYYDKEVSSICEFIVADKLKEQYKTKDDIINHFSYVLPYDLYHFKEDNIAEMHYVIKDNKYEVKDDKQHKHYYHNNTDKYDNVVDFYLGRSIDSLFEEKYLLEENQYIYKFNTITGTLEKVPKLFQHNWIYLTQEDYFNEVEENNQLLYHKFCQDKIDTLNEGLISLSLYGNKEQYKDVQEVQFLSLQINSCLIPHYNVQD